MLIFGISTKSWVSLKDLYPYISYGRPLFNDTDIIVCILNEIGVSSFPGLQKGLQHGTPPGSTATDERVI